MAQLPTEPVESPRPAAMQVDLADLERLERSGVGVAVAATAMMGPSVIPFMLGGGSLWLSLMPPLLWGLFTAYLWRRYIRLAGQAARLRLEIEENEASL